RPPPTAARARRSAGSCRAAPVAPIVEALVAGERAGVHDGAVGRDEEGSMRRHPTPLGAVLRGLWAGAAGALAQNLFFLATRRIAPQTPRDVFQPPEEIQKQEPATETVARRVVEGLAARPLSAARKQLGGSLVHHGFGAAWGGLYGLARESL